MRILLSLALTAMTVWAEKGPVCEPGVGLKVPIAECTQDNPCDSVLATYLRNVPPITRITTPSDAPECRTSPEALAKGRPNFNDGEPKKWKDAAGVMRYHCEFQPPGPRKKPLLVYIPPSGGNAAYIYNMTSLRDKARLLSVNDGFPTGFVLVGVQARNLHWPTTQTAQDGTKFDSFYRDFANNRDVAHIDQIIDTLVAKGDVDPQRIYLSGWSNGARFASFYGIQRFSSPTPKGNRVAAVASYSGGDPYENLDEGVTPSCKQKNYPKSGLPVMIVSRSCDMLTCSEEQKNTLETLGLPIPPGNVMGTWMGQLKNMDAQSQWMRIGDDGSPDDRCVPSLLCGRIRALKNHITWPDAIGNGNDNDLEVPMLKFLAKNPRK